MHCARPANDHRGCCSAKDYEIKGRAGVIRVTGPRGEHVRFSMYSLHTWWVEDTELHCAFIRI